MIQWQNNANVISVFAGGWCGGWAELCAGDVTQAAAVSHKVHSVLASQQGLVASPTTRGEDIYTVYLHNECIYKVYLLSVSIVSTLH